jgi:Transcription factor WhiB
MPDSLFTAMLRSETWDSAGLCRTAPDPNVFFPATESPAAVAWVSSRYCDHCPVKAQCLDQAIASQDGGLWAGTTTAERKKLTRTRNRQRCPLCTSENRIFVREIGDGPDHELCLACGVSWKVNEGPGSPAWTAKYPPSWKRGTYDASTGRIEEVPALDGVL